MEKVHPEEMHSSCQPPLDKTSVEWMHFLQPKYTKVTPTYTSPMILDPCSWDDVTDHFLGLVHLRYN